MITRGVFLKSNWNILFLFLFFLLECRSWYFKLIFLPNLENEKNNFIKTWRQMKDVWFSESMFPLKFWGKWKEPNKSFPMQTAKANWHQFLLQLSEVLRFPNAGCHSELLWYQCLKFCSKQGLVHVPPHHYDFWMQRTVVGCQWKLLSSTLRKHPTNLP